jgi:hypothetical protein
MDVALVRNSLKFDFRPDPGCFLAHRRHNCRLFVSEGRVNLLGRSATSNAQGKVPPRVACASQP